MASSACTRLHYAFLFRSVVAKNTLCCARSFHKASISFKPVRAIIMGPPGSGKGTISERIVKVFGLDHLSSGDMLRKHIKDNTKIGQEAKKYIDSGNLVPDNLIIDFTLQELKKRNGGWLLDGFPRTLNQSEILSKNAEIDVVINLDVPFETIIERIKQRWIHLPSGRVYNLEFNPPKQAGKDDVTGEPLSQREDDKPETVKARLEKYEEQTKPLVEYYRNLNKLESFSGTETNVIWPMVKKYLQETFFTKRRKKAKIRQDSKATDRELTTQPERQKI